MRATKATRRNNTFRSASAARWLIRAFGDIGTLTCRRRLGGYAIFDDDAMFGFVNCRGESFLRTDSATAARFHELGATKHPEMPYWRIPQAAFTEPGLLKELAYEAADVAHLADSLATPIAAEPLGHSPIAPLLSSGCAA